MEKKAKDFQSKLDQAFPSFVTLMQHPKDAKSWLVSFFFFFAESMSLNMQEVSNILIFNFFFFWKKKNITHWHCTFKLVL